MKRRGTILAAVLVITALGAMVAASMLYSMRAEVAGASASTRGHQAYLAAVSGVQQAIAVLQVAREDMDVWWDNPSVFRNRLVHDDGVNRWYFTIYAPGESGGHSEDKSVRYGLIDEASKINLNFADAKTLANLPGMTAERVDCLQDYKDPDSETRRQGAEQDHYSSLPHPYIIKNGPLATIEELLLVKGFDAQAVYGDDYNLNGILDKNEDDAKETFPPDNHDGQLDRGLLGMATVVSFEKDVDREGNPRVGLSGDLAALAGVGLPAKTLEFIRAARRDGQKLTEPAQLLEMRYQRGGGDDSDRSSRIDAGEEVRGGDGWIESGVGAAELPVVMDKLVAGPGPRSILVAGLVNVNTAPANVLAVIDGIGEDLAGRIVAARGEVAPEQKTTIAWLYTEGLTDAATFKKIAGRLTARSYQFRIRCVGFGVPCGRFYVLEAIVDLRQDTPRIVYTRELTRLGLPMAMDVDTQEQEQ